MSYNVFIDGQEGTTGLKIYERFAKRTDINLMQISSKDRKNPTVKKELINSADFVFLCLPDTASIESVALCENPHTRIIDSSTAHRTAEGWAYGFPELDKSFRDNIKNSARVAVPGCYASGFNSICYPLIHNGIIPRDYPVVCHAVSGYSGAGKKAIAVYESPMRYKEFNSPRLYALTQHHKHLKEMQTISGLKYAPIFNPYVCDYYQGMTVTISLFTRLFSRTVSLKNVHEIFENHYRDCHFLRIMPFMDEDEMSHTFIAASTLENTNNMQIFICGNDERIVITSQFDNLGKGASGAAMQCMNIMMGIDESTSLQ